MTDAPILTGQDIGEAEHATRALLDRLLDEIGTTFPKWVTLNTLATRGSAVDRDSLRRIFTEGLAVDPSSTDALVETLAADGLVRQGRRDVDVELTPDGEALVGRIRDGIGSIAVQLYGDLDEADLTAARRVLSEVTARARVQLAR